MLHARTFSPIFLIPKPTPHYHPPPPPPPPSLSLSLSLSLTLSPARSHLSENLVVVEIELVPSQFFFSACDLTLGSAENPLGSAANRSPRLGKSERAVINTRRPASLTSSLLAVQTLVLEIPYRTRMLNGCKGNFVLWKPALNHKQAIFFKNLHSSFFTKVVCVKVSSVHLEIVVQIHRN